MSKEHDIRYTKVVIGHCDLFLLYERWIYL